MYELNFWADGFYLVVMEGMLEQCQDYACNFCKWNDYGKRRDFLMRDKSDYSKQYYFDAEFEPIPTAEYLV